ncbi:MAG: proprotein convertase P-domain-containing protein, partial [Sandaracinaceae bacterium]
ANSTPAGAMVTGGGRALGVTPLQTQVPIPAPQPGQAAPTFAFTFQAAGYQTATVNATPMNNTITITAALAPAVAPTPVGAGGGDVNNGGGNDGPSLRVNGRGGGPIYDRHTTTGTAVVQENCVIDRLRVRLRGRHSYYGDLHISLRSPAGRSYSLARGGSANPFRTHTVRRASGQQARGRWTLSIADRLAQDSGVLNGWNMEMTCR